MSRSASPENDFNPTNFATLLGEAKGKRTQQQFAMDCGLSLSFISKYLTLKMDTPPVPKTLRKIADCASNDVTYELLLEAAGYNPQKYTNENFIKVENSKNNEKLAIGIITSHLAFSDFKWSGIKQRPTEKFIPDFEIQIENPTLKTWYFEIILASSPERISEHLLGTYGRLITSAHESNIKLSFVTNSEFTYEEVKKAPPQLLPFYVSVVLLDLEDFSVVKEEYLQTALPITKELQTVYTIAPA